MLVINIIGAVLILLIIWWFWLYKPKEITAANGDIKVLVENGTYVPSRIKVKNGQTFTMQFVRKDESPCAETLLFPELEISESLPLNRPKNIELPAMKPGEYQFHCQMQMYRGVLLVE